MCGFGLLKQTVNASSLGCEALSSLRLNPGLRGKDVESNHLDYVQWDNYSGSTT
jgi:hypothetical protein